MKREREREKNDKRLGRKRHKEKDTWLKKVINERKA